MIKWLRLLIKDIRSGENVDVYLTILISAVVAVLGILGIVNSLVISAATLATLGLFANSSLANRRQGKELKDISSQLDSDLRSLQQDVREKARASDFLLREYPDFSNEFRNAKRVSILGSSLVTTVNTYYPELEYLLQRGDSLRCLLPKPTPEIVTMMAFRSGSATDNPDLIANTIQNSLARAAKLEEKAKNPEGLEIRTIPYMTPFGLVIIEKHDGTVKVYVKLMAFRAPRQLPTFMLNGQTDGVWFQFFINQFENLWNLADSKR